MNFLEVAGAASMTSKSQEGSEMNDLSFAEPRISDHYGFRIDLLIRSRPIVIELGGSDYFVHVLDCIPAQFVNVDANGREFRGEQSLLTKR